MCSSPGQAVPSASRKRDSSEREVVHTPSPLLAKTREKGIQCSIHPDSVHQDIVDIPGAATSPPSHNPVPSLSPCCLPRSTEGMRVGEIKKKAPVQFSFLITNPGYKANSKKVRGH